MRDNRARTYGRIAAGVLIAWVLITGAIAGIGKLIMISGNGNGNLLGDHAIPHWFAAHRTATLDQWSATASPGRAGRGPLGLQHRKTAGDSRVTAPAD